jgi:phosphoglycerol transferase MdoB-like AlkP superfamily enzyme
MAKAAKKSVRSKETKKNPKSVAGAQQAKSSSASKVQPEQDRISKLWILAGIIEIGLIGAPARLAKSSSTHKNLRNIFILLFVFALLSVGSSFAGFFVGYWIFFILQIIIAAALYLSLRYTDKPFATMSLYVMIGLLISLVLVIVLSTYYASGALLPSGTTFSLQPQYVIPVNFTVYNTSVISGSYTSTAPVYSAIISQSDYNKLNQIQNYTPTFYWDSGSGTNGSIYATLQPGNYVLAFSNGGFSQATVTIQNGITLTKP